jgi:putative flippase GtrA
MTSAMRVVVLYSLIALIATLANLGSQAVVIRLYSNSNAVGFSILTGTAIGLPIKYILEKKHIFAFSTRDLKHDSQLFMVYSAFGVLTTLLFWGIEYLFHRAFGTSSMRYTGGAIGLAIGYALKYRLDKKYVFVTRETLTKGST